MPAGYVIIDIIDVPQWCTLRPTQNELYNTFVLRRIRDVAIGDTLDLCTLGGAEPQFDVVAWFTDDERCQVDPSWVWKNDPNVMRVIRLY